jgi:uncharacterized phage infection (PIP) family protein YhgE
MKDQAETALIPLTDAELPSLYGTPQLEQVLTRIETEVRSQVLDVETAAGRKEIASLAHKIARSKTALDKAGLDLTKDMRDKIAAVNADRNVVKTRLDDLKLEIRNPLDEWEAADEQRKARIRERLEAFHHNRTDWRYASADIRSVIEDVTAIIIDDSWDEFEAMAQSAKDSALQKFRTDLDMAIKQEEQAAESARIKAEKEAEIERLRLEQEAELKQLREEKARLEAEAAERARQDALEKATQEASREPDGDTTPEKIETQPQDAQEVSQAETQPADTQTTTEAPQQSPAPVQSASGTNILADITDALSKIPRAAIPHAIISGKVPHVIVSEGANVGS